MPRTRSHTKLSSKYSTTQALAMATTEELVTSVITTLLKSDDFIKLIQKTVNTALEKLTLKVDTNSADILDLDTKYKELSNEIKKVNTELEVLREFKFRASRDNNNLEQYTRRNNLRILGVPSSKGEDTNNIVMELVEKKLNIKLSPEDIDRSHRVGKSENNAPAIIVKFTRHDIKTQILRARRQLKGTRVIIREDLTKINQNLLKAAKANVKVTNAWSWDGRIYATVNGSDSVHTIRDQGDVNRI